MRKTSLRSGTWPSIVARVSEAVALETTARAFKALQRKRKIRSAEGLFRLALMYGPGLCSLRGAAVAAGDAGIADLSDKAVEGRSRKMGGARGGERFPDPDGLARGAPERRRW